MPKEIIQGFRLSPQQRRLWTLHQADHNRVYQAQWRGPDFRSSQPQNSENRY